MIMSQMIGDSPPALSSENGITTRVLNQSKKGIRSKERDNDISSTLLFNVIDLTKCAASSEVYPPDPTLSEISQYIPVGRGMVRRLSLLSDPLPHRSTPHLNLSRQPHPVLQLIPEDQRSLIQSYCQLQPSIIILRMTQRPNIKLLVQDITTLITPGEQIHHELLLFGLENATKIYNGTYLEPALFPILQQRGWSEVIGWFTSHNSQHKSIHNHPNLNIPVHIHGNHWVAINRRTTQGKSIFSMRMT